LFQCEMSCTSEHNHSSLVVLFLGPPKIAGLPPGVHRLAMTGKHRGIKMIQFH